MADERERLKVLLPHWMEHNAEHAEEFRRWAERVRGVGGESAADRIMAAAQAMEKAIAELEAALASLEGAG
ncbi:MAG: hypothetical protein HPY83_18875 [Anaerolineae bacterium]|nr:hypothetical protein [Anaerolineae bacterium]